MPTTCNNESNKKQLKNVFKQFKNVTKNPEDFLIIQPTKAEKAKLLLRDIYDISVKNVDNEEHDNMVLPELVLDGMDEEQIWQQIEIRNNSVWSKFVEKTSKFLATKDESFLLNCVSENSFLNSHNQIESNGEISSDAVESDDDFETNIDSQKKTKNKKKFRSSIVDDEFFKLAEMENFLNQEDRRETLRQSRKLYDSDDSIDYFENISDEDEENARYQEFFDNEEEEELSQESLEKNRRRNLNQRRSSEGSVESRSSNENEYDEDELYNQKINNDSEQNSSQGNNEDSDSASESLEKEMDDEGEEEEEEENDEQFDNEEESDDQKEGANQINGDSADENDDNEVNRRFTEEKSSFEEKQERLKKRIEEYEEKILQEKPWQLKGEITSTDRPQNSLLEEVLEFDAAIRPAPVITEETTLRLEDIIKQRIKDKAWDDVERKYKPIQTPQEFRKKLVLDQEKSKESLAQIYEKEYHSQLEKFNSDGNNGAEEEPKEHKEIRELMKLLFTKLDALSNFHYTPKPVAPEPRIITNTPALNMEEVAPVAVSDANLLAPEEIKNRPKGNVIGKSERQQTDKKRERRKKKLHQKALYKRQEEKEASKQKLGLKSSKKEEKDKNLKNVIKHRNVQKADVNSELTSTYKSSKTFFSILQDKTTSIGKRKGENSKKEGITAKKMKL